MNDVISEQWKAGKSPERALAVRVSEAMKRSKLIDPKAAEE
jgi:hypothetical protein